MAGLCVALAALAVANTALAEPETSSGNAAAAAKLAETKISVRGNDLPLGLVINQIARSAQLAPVIDKEVNGEQRIASVSLDATPLDAALAIILTPLGYSYEVDAEHRYLRVFVYSTRTFKVAMPAVAQSWVTSISNVGGGDATAGGGGGTASSSGALGAKIAISTRSDTAGLWEEVDRSMEHLLQTGDAEKAVAPQPGEKKVPALGTFSTNRVAGFVTVRALPSVMPTVVSYFDALNSEMGRVVTVEVRLIQVDLNDDRAAGIDWNMAAASLGKAFVGSASNLAPVTANNVFNGTILGSTPPLLHISGRAGSALVKALEQQGKVHVVAQPALALGNNLPAIVELAELQAYVSSIQTVTAGVNVPPLTSVQTSTVQNGLMMSIMPRVLDDGEVSLAVGLILQDILAITNFSISDGNAVELPHTLRRSYNGVMRAKVGETVVLGGLISERKEKQTAGIPFLSKVPVIGFLFGENEWIEKKSELVLTVTPREIQSMKTTSEPMRAEPEDD